MDTERYTTGRRPETTTVVPSSPIRLPHEADIADRFRERLRLFAARRLGNAAAAEDVAQETLRRVVDALRAGRVANPAAFPSFVFETARHICLQQYRSAGREGRALHRLHDGSGVHPSTGLDPLTALVSEERRNRVREALGELGGSDRELLRMLYHQEVETAEVASRLGITPATVRVRKHRALKRLGELLDRADL
ncbi:MAG TPA: sigma-70 family RNA polymerase sigma factor [Gammaproteobacteria bacterium]|nr:sigma-70 family RNA polymerase sigma factor [Gammaproteobacteria bacterium]